MILDSIIGLAVAVIVLSSVAWVSQYRKIRSLIRARKVTRAHAAAVKSGIAKPA